MLFLGAEAGLTPDFLSPPTQSDSDEVVTEEIGIRLPSGPSLPVTPLVAEGDLVACGAPVACLRHSPDTCFVAPVAGRVAEISLLPGRRLSEILLVREDQAGTEHHDTKQAQTEAGLRRLMQISGMWVWLRRRPFGGMPAADERPAAIVVMATDTRPLAPNPVDALYGRADDFARGLSALERLSEGPILVATAKGAPGPALPKGTGRVQVVPCGTRHPQGLPGLVIHRAFPADLETPVWDVHAEDVAALGALLATGALPMTRLVHVAGPGLREARILRTHPGADLRQLTWTIISPGPHSLMSGSPLDGHVARWLAPRHRQLTVLPRAADHAPPHWLIGALTRSATTPPVIPTAAVTQALGAVLPAMPFLRALGVGNDESAMKLGVLSLLEEDLALADYVLGSDGALMRQLREMLDRIQTELAP